MSYLVVYYLIWFDLILWCRILFDLTFFQVVLFLSYLIVPYFTLTSSYLFFTYLVFLYLVPSFIFAVSYPTLQFYCIILYPFVFISSCLVPSWLFTFSAYFTVSSHLDWSRLTVSYLVLSRLFFVFLISSYRQSLERIFPCGLDMALIVDDRDDVWRGEQAKNLLLVRPYKFFVVSWARLPYAWHYHPRVVRLAHTLGRIPQTDFLNKGERRKRRGVRLLKIFWPRRASGSQHFRELRVPACLLSLVNGVRRNRAIYSLENISTTHVYMYLVDASSAAVFVCVWFPLFWGKSARKLAPGGVLS